MIREVIVPTGSLIIALAGILLSYFSLSSQMWLQETQVKYKGYGILMGELRMAFYSKHSGSPQPMWDHINKAWAEYYPLETYVHVGKRKDLRESLVAVVLACEKAQSIHAQPSELENAQEEFNNRHQILSGKLEKYLGLGER
ncbi:MAG: hypothetical protein A4E72_00994 [Syntrophus sp. PtaU1.Bin208]|nr:MAG: hypothetical protein A4E72_00994 [Syntrophus sp. PtaU1.Bin208]